VTSEPDVVSSPMPSTSSARSGLSAAATVALRPYVSKIGVLPSSVPAYHKDYMEREKAGIDEPLAPPAQVEEPAKTRTDAEKEETARRLKPHSRSQLRIEEANRRPQGLTPVNAPRKPKPTRWQFGIRSRNAPWEALLCIHKALNKLGATYMPDEGYERAQAGEGEGEGNSVEGSFVGDYDGAPLERRANDSTSSIDPLNLYRLPADPWHITVRWETKSTSPACSAAKSNHMLTRYSAS
jgi:carbon catabolite-derepressing protein kinase